jgi:hypothetical protein
MLNTPGFEAFVSHHKTCKKQTLITSVLYSFLLISLSRLINYVVVDLRHWRKHFGEFAFRFRSKQNTF